MQKNIQSRNQSRNVYNEMYFSKGYIFTGNILSMPANYGHSILSDKQLALFLNSQTLCNMFSDKTSVMLTTRVAGSRARYH